MTTTIGPRRPRTTTPVSGPGRPSEPGVTTYVLKSVPRVNDEIGERESFFILKLFLFVTLRWNEAEFFRYRNNCATLIAENEVPPCIGRTRLDFCMV